MSDNGENGDGRIPLLITNRIVKLELRADRTWRILGQVNDIPGGCRPAHIWPIVEKVSEDAPYDIKQIPRTRADGFIDAANQFGYAHVPEDPS